VAALAQGADGTLWIGTDRGLARLDQDGRWLSYTTANSGLPSVDVSTLMMGADGARWVGTLGGLARLDNEGHWQSYTTANTNGGLPSGAVQALAPDASGGLWVGTAGYDHGGVGYLIRSPTSTSKIVDVIGGDPKRVTKIGQEFQNVAVVALDRSYLTQPQMFRYAWHLTERRWFGAQPGPEVITRSSVYTARFEHNGNYVLSVAAIDRYGIWSEPEKISLAVTLPKANPLRETIISVAIWIVSTGAIYSLLIFPLITLYPRSSLARTATNSGVFTKFPFLHKAILNTAWARAYLFRRYTERVIAEAIMPEPYIPQSLFAEMDKTAQRFRPDGGTKSLAELFAVQRRALLIARSGTGKSVFLHHLVREVGARFLNGERVPLPVLINLRTHVLSGRAVEDLVVDTLRGGGIELSDLDLKFLIGKGGFLILVDSLNELPDPLDARLFHTFFNQDAHNRTLIASQLDLIHREDVRIFNLAEVTPEQAAKYLEDAAGGDVYSNLPPEAQALSRNPQDLALLAEIAKSLGAANVPTHRAELYSAILNEDGSLRPWVAGNDPRLATIYALAFRMIAEQRVLSDDQLRDWVATEPNVEADDVAAIVKAVQASRLFRNEVTRDILGREQSLTGFRP
jgi:hypothetical protein